MSYRSFKRVLGETSLERKCRFLFGACLLVLITGSFWWYSSQTDQLVIGQYRRGAMGMVDAILAVQHWEVLELRDEFKPIVKRFAEDMRNQEYHWRTITPTSPKGRGLPEDEFEKELLERWQKVGRDLTAGQEFPTRSAHRHAAKIQEWQYYEAIFAKHACVNCHAPFGIYLDSSVQVDPLQEGDLMAIIQVRIPDEDTVEAINRNRAILLTIAIITVFLAMIALYVIVRYVIVKPLQHLRDVSDEISRGNIDLRADIQTGDEFEQLAQSFNRMVRQLSGAQAELREVNHDLESKVDELAQVNMRLYEMNRLKGDFLATVSHELRTPLNSIIGFSDVLDSIDVLNDKQKRYVQNIQRSGRMLLEMINDILDLAKIESGKMEIRLSQVNIERVISAQCDLARPLTERKNIDLEYRVTPDLPELVQDEGKVQQILSNLLSNAIKFTPEGGRITISARRRDDGDLLLVVADTGVGIADGDQVTVFEKFRQGTTGSPSGDAMTREHSGTGLGLSIVKEICRLLGGEVSLQSDLGKGSTFTVRLPWTRVDEPHIESPLVEGLEEMTRPRRNELGEHVEVGLSSSPNTP